MRTNWFHVLVALADQELHGSGIVRDVLEQTEGTLRLWPATLYRTLEEMTEAGLIEELTGDAHPEGERGRKRYYRTTPEGKSALADEAARLADLALTANRRLGRA